MGDVNIRESGPKSGVQGPSKPEKLRKSWRLEHRPQQSEQEVRLSQQKTPGILPSVPLWLRIYQPGLKGRMFVFAKVSRKINNSSSWERLSPIGQ